MVEIQPITARIHSAAPAALAVERKLTASLFSQPRSSSVAPSRLSKKRPKTAPAATYREQSQIAAQGPGSGAGNRSRRNHAGQRAGQAHRAVPARIHRAQGCNHARPAAEHLPDLGGDCVCRGFSQRGQRQGKKRRLRDRHGAESSGNRAASTARDRSKPARRSPDWPLPATQIAPFAALPCPAALFSPGPPWWRQRRALKPPVWASGPYATGHKGTRRWKT